MNDFTTKLKLYNDKIEELELEIIKKDFDLKYTKVLLKKAPFNILSNRDQKEIEM